MSKTNFLSSVNSKGEIVDKVIILITGFDKKYKGVITSTIEQDNQFTKFNLKDNRHISVKTSNVGFVEITGVKSNRKGNLVDLIFILNSGIKNTYEGVLEQTIEKGEFMKFELKDGRLIMANMQNIGFIENFKNK